MAEMLCVVRAIRAQLATSRDLYLLSGRRSRASEPGPGQTIAQSKSVICSKSVTLTLLT